MGHGRRVHAGGRAARLRCWRSHTRDHSRRRRRRGGVLAPTPWWRVGEWCSDRIPSGGSGNGATARCDFRAHTATAACHLAGPRRVHRPRRDGGVRSSRAQHGRSGHAAPATRRRAGAPRPRAAAAAQSIDRDALTWCVLDGSSTALSPSHHAANRAHARLEHEINARPDLFNLQSTHPHARRTFCSDRPSLPNDFPPRAGSARQERAADGPPARPHWRPAADCVRSGAPDLSSPPPRPTPPYRASYSRRRLSARRGDGYP